ncbi:MAP3K14 [Branchiostoma lanceolatum]|uniref:MAP3K14 protein n=1 Tax=Branchiostoma lanceolatum TaxID=7740 RepID=A0A8K0E400_BRALA|nr:MAP3K14 [Branchiostoma lanceolatum]
MAITSDTECTTPKEAHLKEKEEKEKSDTSKDVPDPSPDPSNSVLKDSGTDRVCKILTVTDNKYIEEAENEDSIVKPGVTETDNIPPEKSDGDDLQVSLPSEKEDENTITTQPQQCDLSFSLPNEKEAAITTWPQQCDLSVSLSNEKEDENTITTQPQQQTGKQQVSDFVDEDLQGWSKADLEANREKNNKENGPAEKNVPNLTHPPELSDPRVVAKFLFSQYPEPFVQKVILHLMDEDDLDEDTKNSSEREDDEKEKAEDLEGTDPDKDVEEESEKIDILADKNSASYCHDNASETEDVEENEAVFEKDTEEALEKTMKATIRTNVDGKTQQKSTKRTPTKTEYGKQKTAHAEKRAFKRDKKKAPKQKIKKHPPRSQRAVVKRKQFHRKPAKYKNSHGRRRGRRGGGRQAARRAPGDKNSQQSNSGSQTQTSSNAGTPSTPLPLHSMTSQSSASGDDGDGDPPRRPPSAPLQRTPNDGQVIVQRKEKEEEEPPEDIVTTLTALLSDGVVFPEQDQVQQFIQALATSYLHRQHRGAANWASCNCTSCKVVHGAIKHVTACSKPAGHCEICSAVFYCAVSHSRSCDTHRLCPIAFCRDVKIKFHEVNPGPVRGITETLWSFLKITIKRSAPRSSYQTEYGAGADGPASLPVFPGYHLRQEYMSLPYNAGAQPPPSLPPSAMLGARPKTLNVKPPSSPHIGQQGSTFRQPEPFAMLGARPKMAQQPPQANTSLEQDGPEKKERKLPACLRPRGGKKEPEVSPAPVAPPRRRRKKSTLDNQEEPPPPPPPEEEAPQNPPQELGPNVGPMEPQELGPNVGPMEGFCHDDFRLENPIGRRDVKLRPIELTPRSGRTPEPDDITQNNQAVVHAYFQDGYAGMTFNDNSLPCLQKGSEETREDLVVTRGDYLQQRSVQSLVSSSIQLTSSVRGLLPSYNNTLYNYSQVVAAPPDGLHSQTPAVLPNKLSQLVSAMSLPQDAIASILSMVRQPVLPPLGSVSAVSPRHVSIFAAHWEQLAEELLTTNRRVTNQEHEGFILDLHAEKLPPSDGRFRLEQQWWSIMELGSGRFGTVYLSCLASEEQEFHFAAKKLDVTQVRRDELEICCCLDNPYIAAHFGAVREGRETYIFMEFLEGYTLEKIIDQYRTLHQYMALFYLCQVFEGLVYLEEQRIVHSDIKAANMMVSSDGARLKLIDFGMAHIIPDGAEWVEPQRNAFPEGTQTHMPTEVAECKPHNCKVDVWSGCCVGLHMLNGCHPWIRHYSHAATLLLIIVNKAEEIKTEIPSSVHESFQSLLRIGLDPDPTTRPSAAAMLTMADDALTEVYSAVGSGPPSPTETSPQDLTPPYSPHLAPEASGGGYGPTTSELRRIMVDLDQDDGRSEPGELQERWDSEKDAIVTPEEQGGQGFILLNRGGGKSHGEGAHKREQPCGNEEGMTQADVTQGPSNTQDVTVEAFPPVSSLEDCNSSDARTVSSAETSSTEQRRLTPEGRLDVGDQQQCPDVGRCPMPDKIKEDTSHLVPMQDKGTDISQQPLMVKVLPTDTIVEEDPKKEQHQTTEAAPKLLTLNVVPTANPGQENQDAYTEMVTSPSRPQESKVHNTPVEMVTTLPDPQASFPTHPETKTCSASVLQAHQNVTPPSQPRLVAGGGLFLGGEESLEDIYLGETDKHKMPLVLQGVQGLTGDGNTVTTTMEAVALQPGLQSLPAMMNNMASATTTSPPPTQPASLQVVGNRSRVRLACAFSHPLHTPDEKEEVAAAQSTHHLTAEMNSPLPQTPPELSPVTASSPSTEGSLTTQGSPRKGSFFDLGSPVGTPLPTLERKSSNGNACRTLAREASRTSSQSVEEVEEQLFNEFLMTRMLDVDDLDEQEELIERASQLSASSYLGGKDQPEDRVLEYGTSSGVESGTPSPSDPHNIMRTISNSSAESSGSSGVLVRFLTQGNTLCQCRVKPAKSIVELCEGVANTIHSRGFDRFTIVHTDGAFINADATVGEQGSRVVGQELSVEVVGVAGENWKWCINEQCILEYQGEGERMFPCFD